jgi:hypothetical protein
MTPTVNTLSTTNAKSSDTTMSTVASSTISSVPQCRDSTVTVLPSSSSSVLSPLASLATSNQSFLVPKRLTRQTERSKNNNLLPKRTRSQDQGGRV